MQPARAARGPFGPPTAVAKIVNYMLQTIGFSWPAMLDGSLTFFPRRAMSIAAEYSNQWRGRDVMILLKHINHTVDLHQRVQGSLV